MTGSLETETDELVQVLRHRHVFAELQEGPLERRQLEDRLDVSRSTSHRYVRTLQELGLVEKTDGRYALTDLGAGIAEAVATFETEVGTRLRLAPMMDVVRDVTPPVDIAAFEDATVTSVDHGEPFAPLRRFVSLVQKTETLRGINTARIAPTYLDEFQGRILDGMQTELIDSPHITEDIMERYPEKIIQVCASENVTILIHEDEGTLPFGLVLLDDHVAIGLFHTTKGTLETLIDTDEPAAIEWATAVYDQYKSESTQLDNATLDSLKEAIARF